MIGNKRFLLGGLIIAPIIGVMSVFFASPDPDGLESTALMVSGQKTLTGSSPSDGNFEATGTGTFSYEAPLPDYSPRVPMGKSGGVIGIIAGIFLAILGVIGVSWVIKVNSDKIKA